MLIKIPESEFTPLLDRSGVTNDVKEHLAPWTNLIQDLVNYGSNLIPRSFGSSDRRLADAVVLGVFLRQVLAMLDGIELLLSNGAVHTANLQMRALFEASVYIDWIMLSDSETKASYYYVHNLRRKRLWAQRTQPGTRESRDFAAAVSQSGLRLSDEIKSSAKELLNEIDRVLAQRKFAKISQNIEKHRKGKPFDPAWFAPLGERNLGTMSKTVGRHSQYVLLYSGASEVMHTSNYSQHLRFEIGKLTFQPIRSAEGFETVFRFSVGIALSAFMKILDHYRPGERQAFARKYQEKWRDDFMNVPKIVVNEKTSSI